MGNNGANDNTPTIIYKPTDHEILIETLARLNDTLNRLTPYLDRMEAAMNRPAVNWLLGGKRNG